MLTVNVSRNYKRLSRSLDTLGRQTGQATLHNPGSSIESLKGGSGWKQWPEPALERFRQNSTGPVRTAFFLALYTGQWKSGVLAML